MPLFKGTTPDQAFQDRIRKAGEFRKPSDPLPKPSHLHEKRMPREPVFANATVVHQTGKLAAIVVNVNSLGARVEFTNNIPLKGEIVLLAPSLGINSRVRVAWQKGGSAGLIFVKQEPAAG